MNVLVVAKLTSSIRQLVTHLQECGHCVESAESLAAAMILTHQGHYELLVAALLIDGENTLGPIIAAEYRNPDISIIVLSDGTCFAKGELFGMLASLRCVLPDAGPANDLQEIAGYLLAEADERHRAALRADQASASISPNSDLAQAIPEPHAQQGASVFVGGSDWLSMSVGSRH